MRRRSYARWLLGSLGAFFQYYQGLKVCRFIASLLAITAVAGCRSDGLDTKLSTELQQARLVVKDWPPHPDSTEASTTKPPHTACALHLVDQATGTTYQVARTYKTKPDGGTDDPATWPEQGDYSVHRPSGSGRGGDARVRIECGTWKILGIVSSRSSGAKHTIRLVGRQD